MQTLQPNSVAVCSLCNSLPRDLLRRYPGLRSLDLKLYAVSGAPVKLEQLAGFRHLSHLALDGSRVGNSELCDLAAAAVPLASLSLRNCTQVRYRCSVAAQTATGNNPPNTVAQVDPRGPPVECTHRRGTIAVGCGVVHACVPRLPPERYTHLPAAQGRLMQ